MRLGGVRVREWRHSSYGEEISVGIGCEIRKFWKGLLINMKV